MPRFFRVAVVLAGLAATVAASAEPGDRTAAEALLKEVTTSPRKDVAEDLVSRSKSALDRAAKLRSAGDEAHAKLADRLARTWAEAARDVARAAVVEESAAIARRSLADAGALADRERALLEEAIAQSGRLRAQLEAASREREGKDQPAKTSTAATKPTPAPKGDAGAPKPAKDETTAPKPVTGAGAAKDGAPTSKPATGAGAAKDEGPTLKPLATDGGAR